MGWEKTVADLPLEKTDEQKEERKKLFDSFDPNGNGYLSLAECDRGCKHILGLGEVLPAPVIMRAYHAAKGVAQADGKNQTAFGEDFIERSEFRLFLVYLSRYFELWKMFASMDDDGDRRVTFEEFHQNTDKLAEWNIKIEDPHATFAEIDANGGGMILFDEFAKWALNEAFKSIEKT